MREETRSARTRELAELIEARLISDRDRLRHAWQTGKPFRHFILDNLLPEEFPTQVFGNLPPPEFFRVKATLRERKRVAVDFRAYHPCLENTLFAFQDPKVVTAIQQIIGGESLLPDPTLYASGISLMSKGDFLNPHLDNSHDGGQKLYRIVNLLYYISPGWKLESGGNLELWNQDLSERTQVVSQFNRLVVMETHCSSWHSVDKVLVNEVRACVSNYYFGPHSISGEDFRHVTTFRGRPEQTGARWALRIDGLLRNAAGKAFPSLLTLNRHRRTES